jgi:DNA repair exonuclease SbcCD ATPase subunit
MSNNAKPIALQSSLDKTVSSFETFLTPPEEVTEEVQAEQAETSPEDVVETESEAEVEVEAEAEVEVEDDFEEGEEEVEQSLEEQTEVEEELQPTAYTVKIDGVEQEVTLDELRNGYSRQQDYTRKTQELAQQRKSFEDQQSELAKKDAIYAQLLPQLEASLNGELENEPDWSALYESDPIGYVREKDVWEEKRKKLDAAKAENKRLQEEAMQKQQKQIQDFVDYGQKQLKERIPEWSDAEKSQKDKLAITNYAVNELGFTQDEVNQVIDYRVLLGLRDGMLYRKQVAATKKKPTQKAASRVARPGTANKPKTATPVKKAKMRLAKSGKVQDAAKVFEQLI